MVDILMATYEGETFLPAQLDSIFAQTEQNFKLYVHDDGSKDGTVTILHRYQKKYPEKMILLEGPPTGGAKNNFFFLLNSTQGKYAFFADQDDVWEREKLEITLKKLKEIEEEKGDDIPILVHTDAKVVDSTLQEISPSFFAYQQLPYRQKSLREFLIQNSVTGCTTGINGAARELAKRGGENILMHDWWLGLVCGAFGVVEVLSQPTVQYRQHEKNQVGAKKARSLGYYLDKLGKGEDIKKSLGDTILQGEGFLHQYESSLSLEQKQMLQDFVSLPHQKIGGKWKILNRYGFWKEGLGKKIAQMIYL